MSFGDSWFFKYCIYLPVQFGQNIFVILSLEHKKDMLKLLCFLFLTVLDSHIMSSSENLWFSNLQNLSNEKYKWWRRSVSCKRHKRYQPVHVYFLTVHRHKLISIKNQWMWWATEKNNSLILTGFLNSYLVRNRRK